MRAFNVRLAAIWFIVVFVLGGSLHLLHGFQVRRQSRVMFQAAVEAEQAHNLQTAIEYMRNYLALSPNDIEGEFKLGLWLAEARSAPSAFNILEELLRTGESRGLSAENILQARRKLVDVSLMMNKITHALSHLNVLLQANPKDAELLDLKGQCQASLKKSQESVDTFSAAIAIDPLLVDTYVRKALILRNELGRRSEADRCMEEMIKANDKSPRAYRQYGHYLLELGEFDKALAKAAKILEFAHEDPKALYLAAECLREKRQYDKAIEYATRGVAAEKTDPAQYILLADLKLRTNKLEEAVKHLQEGLAATKGNRGHDDIIWYMINMYINLGRLEDARKAIAEARSGKHREELVLYLEARIYVAEGQWGKALKLFETALPQLVGDPGVLKLTYYGMAQCYQQIGALDQQLLCYKQCLQVDPFYFPAHQGLADNYIGRGQMDDAISELRLPLKSKFADDQAILSLARVLIMNNLRKSKNNEPVDWTEVSTLLDRGKDGKSGPPQFAVLKAEVLLAMNQVDTKGRDGTQQARDLLEGCVKQAPKLPEIHMALINLAMHRASQETDEQKQKEWWEQCEGFIQRSRELLGDHPPARIARAQYITRRNPTVAASELKVLAEDTSTMSPAEKSQLWSVLALLCLQVNDLETAQTLCRRVAEIDTKDIRIRYLQCELALRAQEKGGSPNIAEVDKAIQEIEQLGGRGVYWNYAKAVRAVLEGKNKDPKQLANAQTFLAEAIKQRPSWSNSTVLSGKICEVLGDSDQALELYLHAIHRLGERDMDILRRTLKLLFPRGRFAEAKSVVDYVQSVKRTSILEDMGQQIAEIEVFIGKLDVAEKKVDASVNATSRNYADYLWQGQMYAYLAQRAKREVPEPDNNRRMLLIAQKAVNCLLAAKSLKPEAEETWVGLVQVLVNVEQPQKAEPVVAEAETKLKSNQSNLTLAQCYELLKKIDKAQVKYDMAAQAAPQDSRVLRQVVSFYLRNNKLAEADPYLKKMVALQSPASLRDVCWARRVMAAILENRGHYEDIIGAMALIEQNIASSAVANDDYRAKVRLLLLDPGKERLGDAIKFLERIVARADATTDDRFVLAQLYLRRHDWNAYCDRMRGVLGSDKRPAQPEQVASYVDNLLKRNQFVEAAPWLEKLEQINAAKIARRNANQATNPSEKKAPASDMFGAVRLRAEYHFRNDKYNNAIDTCFNFLESVPEASDRQQLVLFVAAVMEDFLQRARLAGKPSAASLFKTRADLLYDSFRDPKTAPGGEPIVAAYLARQGRVREALEILEQCWQRTSPAALQPAAIDVIRAKAITSEQFVQLRKILDASSAKHDRPLPLMLVLAELHAHQREYGAAEQAYRDALVKDPQNFLALNNLAVLLALSNTKLDEALEMINGVLKIKGPVPRILDSRGIVYIARKEPDKAIADLQSAIEEDGSSDQYFHLAQAQLLAGNKIAAGEAFALATKATATRKAIKLEDLDVRERPALEKLRQEFPASGE